MHHSWSGWISDGALERLGHNGRATLQTLFELCPPKGVECLGKTEGEKFKILVRNGIMHKLITPQEGEDLIASARSLTNS